ncbi:MAG: hypothetical protein QNJ41_05070 [Xenococcaceae cyanobacterium MO_188.B32]|nr:hypothetical protein [Xenococcaceae cyanobacterium MO_188.B32]
MPILQAIAQTRVKDLDRSPGVSSNFAPRLIKSCLRLSEIPSL